MKFNIRIVGIITAALYFGSPVYANGMSARPPIIFEQTATGPYLQKDLRQDSKALVHDKNGKVIGWARKSHLDSSKTIMYDMNNNVMGYLKKDLMDLLRLRFVNK